MVAKPGKDVPAGGQDSWFDNQTRASRFSSPAEIPQDEEDLEELILRGLPDHWKDIVRMRAMGLSYRKIAETMNMSQNGVRYAFTEAKNSILGIPPRRRVANGFVHPKKPSRKIKKRP